MRATRTAATLALLLALTACGGDDGATGLADRETPDSPQTSTPLLTEDPAASPTDAPAPVDEVTAPATTDPTESTGEQPQGGVVVDGDGFAITFPTQPTVETVEVPLEEGLSTEATIYQAQVGEAFLGFSHADTPDVGETIEFDEEQALRDSAQGAADNTGGEVARADIIDFQGRTAIDYVVTVPGGVLRGIAFFDDVRLYTGQLVAAGESLDRALLDEMMGSLEFT